MIGACAMSRDIECTMAFGCDTFACCLYCERNVRNAYESMVRCCIGVGMMCILKDVLLLNPAECPGILYLYILYMQKLKFLLYHKGRRSFLSRFKAFTSGKKTLHFSLWMVYWKWLSSLAERVFRLLWAAASVNRRWRRRLSMEVETIANTLLFMCLPAFLLCL